jgi:protein phosphatase
MAINVIANTNVGKVRANNEDNFFTSTLKNFPNTHLLLVSDGVGGRDFGEVASQTSVDTFSALIEENKLDVAVDANMREAMMEMAVRRVHMAIADKGKQEPKYKGMSCTLVAALIDEESIGLVNVGDSRLYHFNGSLNQLSNDQTIAQALLKDGRIKPDDLATHPDRNVLQFSLGVEAINSPLEVQTSMAKWEQGDKILLCSDGLTDMISDEFIADFLSRYSGNDLLSKLMDKALNAGGKDNITIVIAENI